MWLSDKRQRPSLDFSGRHHVPMSQPVSQPQLWLENEVNYPTVAPGNISFIDDDHILCDRSVHEQLAEGSCRHIYYPDSLFENISFGEIR